jgi:hypothetical protein
LYLPISSLAHARYMPRPCHPATFVHLNKIWWRLHNMKLRTEQLSPPSCHVLPLWSKYSPKHPVLKHTQCVFFPYRGSPSFTPIQNNKENYIFFMFESLLFK